MDPSDANRVMVPVGQYLIADGKIVHRIDPGICGTENDQLAADGKTVERHIDKKFDAPKAQLFRKVIDGVLGGTMAWELVLIGVFIAIMMELCGVPALAFAVGVYLPISTSSTIFIGGLVRKWSDKRTKLTETEQESSPGVLCSSGLIAGGALVAILSCALLAPKTVTRELPMLDAAGTPLLEADGKPKTAPARVDTTWEDDFTLFSEKPIDLHLANRLVGQEETVGQALGRLGLDAKPVLAVCDESSLAMNARQFLGEHNWWGLGCFLGLAWLLYMVSSRKPKAPPASTSGPI
ncbi:MAG: hypothetical protein EXS13_08280 [Planctomycetes bacterium]|nr:hypothetical protein [Planctomycetota bacterium]